MLFRVLIILFTVGICQSQLASHLLFPLENYLKSIPTFKIPQPATIPVNGELYTVSAPSEKESFIKEEMKTKITATSTTTTSKRSTITTTVASTTIAPQQPDSSEMQQKANMKRLPPNSEIVLPEFKPQEKVVRKPLPKGGDEEIPVEPQGFITMEEKVDQQIVAVSPSTPSMGKKDKMDKMKEDKMDQTSTKFETPSMPSMGKEDKMEKMKEDKMDQTTSNFETPSTLPAFVKEDKMDHTMTSTKVMEHEMQTTIDIPTTRDLLARFKPKQKPEGATPIPHEREFLKNIPHIKFNEIDPDRLRSSNK